MYDSVSKRGHKVNAALKKAHQDHLIAADTDGGTRYDDYDDWYENEYEPGSGSAANKQSAITSIKSRRL